MGWKVFSSQLENTIKCWLCDGQGVIKSEDKSPYECDECSGEGRVEHDPYGGADTWKEAEGLA